MFSPDQDKRRQWDEGLTIMFSLAFFIENYDWDKFCSEVSLMKTPLASPDDQKYLFGFARAIADLKKYTTYFKQRGQVLENEIKNSAKN